MTCMTQTKSSHDYFQQTPPNLELSLPELLQLSSSSSPQPPLQPPDLTRPPLHALSPCERRSLLLSDTHCFSDRRHTPILRPATHADTPALPHQGNCVPRTSTDRRMARELHCIVATGERRHHQHALVIPRQGPTNGPLPWCLVPPQAHTRGPTHGLVP